MNPSSMTDPVAVVTTVQPYLVGWLGAIAFFVTLAIVAVVSKGRKWYELICMFAVVFVMVAGLAYTGMTLIMDVSIINLEVISIKN